MEMLVVDRNLLRRTAAAEVVAGITAFVAGLALLFSGYPRLHASVTAMVFYPLFVHPIAIVYIVSGIAKPSKRVILYLWSTLPIVMAGGLAGFALGPPRGWLPLGLSMLSASPAPLIGLAKARQTSLRLSMLLAFIAYAGSGIVLLASYAYDLVGPAAGVMFLASYAATMIYAVSIHSLPRTYKDDPSGTASILLAVIIAASIGFFAAGHHVYARIVYSVSVIAFIAAARMDRIPSWYRGIEQAAPAARPGHRYFLQGHMAAVPLMVLAGLYMAGEWSGSDALAALHMLTIGFTGVFIYIHAPMMLPVLLKTKTKRRYSPLPYILLVAAALVWPGAGLLAGALFLASLVSLLYIVV